MPNSSASRDRPCPVCGAPSDRYASLSRDFLAAALERFVEAPLPPAVTLRDYAMLRCSSCTLEFADPPAPADDGFYEWVDRSSRYYLSDRWEWGYVEAAIAGSRKSRVLEFGAGDGRFLQRLQRATGAQTVAIERSAAAVANLRQRGMEAYADTEAGRALAGRDPYDFVVAFHCLEHVSDPVSLLRTMRGYAGAAGRVFFSVPYSPMYFESRWFDPLNHPPHHLSRWNRVSLGALASRIGARPRLLMPPAYSVVRRARYALAIHYRGAHWYRQRGTARTVPLKHPLAFARELVRQARRDRVDGQTAADVVLVELAPHGVGS